MSPLLYGRADAARCLAISVRKLDLLISTKKIKAVKVGRRTLIASAELKRFAQRGTA
jgi:excisionase family DNA binding protein